MSPFKLLQPPKLLQSDGFPLSGDHMDSLQIYVYFGQQLPTSIVDYRKEFSLDTVTVRKYQENIDGIIRVYENIHRHTTNFHNNIFPRTVELSSSLYDYAQTAQIYYGAISDAIEKLVHSPGTQSEKQARRIDELLNRQVESMTKMETSADQIVNDLRTFSAETKADQIDASREDKKLDAKLTKYQDDIESLRERIAGIQRNIDARGKSRNNLWSALKAQFSDAKNMAMQIAEEQGSDMTELASCLVMKAKGDVMAQHLGKILELIEPAITTIQIMHGCFKGIANDVKVVKRFVDENLRDPKELVFDVEIDKVLASWESLEKRADSYRQTAYVKPPTM